MIRDGDHVYFEIKGRKTHDSKSHDSGAKLLPVDPAEYEKDEFDGWHGPCNTWSQGLDPWRGKGNDWKPVNREAHDEISSVSFYTGCPTGWWSLKFAKAAIKRLRRRDTEGKHNYKGSSAREGDRQIRTEFQIQRVTVTRRTAVLREAKFEDAA